MTQKQSGSRWKERVLLAVGGLVVLGAILGVAYYHEELATYVHLHAWDPGSAEKLVRDFVHDVRSGDQAAASLLDGDRAKAKMKDGKMVAVNHTGPMGRADVPLAHLVPAADVKSMSWRIRPISKIFAISVEYSDGHWAEFGVDRTPAGLRIADVSDSLGTQKVPEKD